MKHIPYVLLFLALGSCAHQDSKKEQPVSSAATQTTVYDTSFSGGNTYKNILCTNNNSVSYALYLPSSYDTAKKFPVLYFFDAHADGLLPVEKYKTLADMYGFIFIGNNTSKNGNSPEVNASYGDSMFRDAANRFAIDANRMYVSGFSGGAKVAGFIAMQHPEIRGVIACGAPIPLTAPIVGQPFFYIAIAGNEDFNYTDMKKQNNDMDAMQLRHQLLTFDGKHEWPPVDLMQDAISGIELDAMRKQTITMRQELVNEFVEKSNLKISMLEKSGLTYDLYHHYHKMINFLEGLYNVEAYTKKADDISKSPSYVLQAKNKTDAEAREAALKQQYVQLLQEKDENWWTNEINAINKRIKGDTNKEETLAQKRILNYLSLAAYMYANSAINQNNTDAAIHFLNLYKIIDPPNSEHSYLLAEMYATKGDNTTALSFLKDAALLGFSDTDRLQQDQKLSALRNLPDYNLLFERMKTNAEKTKHVK